MPRREFSNPVKREARERAGGICECYRVPMLKRPKGCGQKLGPANTFYEHIVCDFIYGEPTLDNCAVLTKTCWREKTMTFDQPVVAKAKRREDRDSGIDRFTRREPIPGSRNTRFLKRMNGRTELRPGYERRW